MLVGVLKANIKITFLVRGIKLSFVNNNLFYAIVLEPKVLLSEFTCKTFFEYFFSTTSKFSKGSVKDYLVRISKSSRYILMSLSSPIKLDNFF